MRAHAERTIEAAAAISIARAEYERCGLTVDLMDVGAGHYPVRSVSVCDAAGTEVTRGGGKGIAEQATASALFEGLEHFFHREGLRSAARDPRRARTLTVADVVAQPAVRVEAVLLRMAEEYPRLPVGCLSFRSFREPDEVLWYPAFLVNPHLLRYPIPGDDPVTYDGYLRYSSSNGVASGVTRDDALLHALLEVIERNALSLGYVEWFVTDAGSVRLIEPSSLPADLRRLHRAVGDTVGGAPLLIDITTDLGVPAVCAVPPHDGTVCLPGCGASLDAAHAVERALLELLQLWTVERAGSAGATSRLNRSLRIETLSPWPALHRCAMLRPGELLSKVAATGPPPPDVDAKGAPPGEQLDAVVRILSGADLDVYTFCWSPPDSLVSVQSVLVPGLERFFLVQGGIPLLPSGRAARDLPGAVATRVRAR